MVYPCLIVALSLFIIQSEACLPPSPPSPTASSAPQTTTAKTTTAKPKDCPMDGKTCVEEGNVLAIKSADGPDKCSKRKKYFKNI